MMRVSTVLLVPSNDEKSVEPGQVAAIVISTKSIGLVKRALELRRLLLERIQLRTQR